MTGTKKKKKAPKKKALATTPTMSGKAEVGKLKEDDDIILGIDEALR